MTTNRPRISTVGPVASVEYDKGGAVDRDRNGFSLIGENP